MIKFKTGDNVKVASGHEGVVRELYMTSDEGLNIYNVNLFSGLRFVGSIVQSENELTLI